MEESRYNLFRIEQRKAGYWTIVWPYRVNGKHKFSTLAEAQKFIESVYNGSLNKFANKATYYVFDKNGKEIKMQDQTEIPVTLQEIVTVERDLNAPLMKNRLQSFFMDPNFKFIVSSPRFQIKLLDTSRKPQVFEDDMAYVFD
jgi:hypothetical protein